MSDLEPDPGKTWVLRYIPDPSLTDRYIRRWAREEQKIERRDLFECQLEVLVDRVPEQDRSTVESMVEAKLNEAKLRWKRKRVQCLIPSDDDKKNRNRDVQHLVRAIVERVKAYREAEGYAERRTLLMWDESDPAWLAAGSALWTRDGINWMRVGASPWSNPFAASGTDARIEITVPARFNKDRLPKGLIGSSEQMTRVRKQVQMFAPYTFPVLLLGETGTGKEAVANLLHEGSRRPGKLVAVNGALLTAELGAAELFGAVKGAYTGLSKTRMGLIAGAEDGTLFLDELNSTPPSVQAKLLRALADAAKGQIHLEPVGADIRSEKATAGDRTVHARLVTAAQSIDEIREDVLHRVAGLIIQIPPLRDRPEDIGELVEYVLRELNQSTEYHLDGSDKPDKMTKEALRLLEGHTWPGNVRELQRVVRHAWVTARFDGKTSILPQYVEPLLTSGMHAPVQASATHAQPAALSNPPATRWDAGSDDLRREVAALVEKRYEHAMQTHPRNGAAAARMLGFATKQSLDRFRASLCRKARRAAEPQDRGE